MAGHDEVDGDTIVVDDKTGNLTARGNVRTDDDARRRRSEDEADASRRETTATARHFVYDDAKRLATYTGPTAQAHLIGAQGDVTAKSIELFLKEDANELERAEGYDGNGRRS